MVRRNVGWGVALCAEVEGDASDWRIQWEKAPDASGAPDTANRDVLEVLPEGELQLVDRSGIVFVGDGPPWYRCRTVRGDCSTPGDWSDWVQVAPAALPERIPSCQAQGAGRRPTLDVVQTDRSLVVETYQATASPHPDSTAGSGGLEIRYRERREGRGWGDWQPAGGDGWTGTNPVSKGVIRHRTQQKYLQVVARDTSLAGNPVSEVRTVTVKSLQDQIDIPGLGRGPLEDDRSRSGVAGEVPADGRQKAPLWNRRGDGELFDTENERVTGGDFGPGRTQHDGSSNHALSKGRDSQAEPNGGNLSWSPTYNTPPSVEPTGHGGLRRRGDGPWTGDGTEPDEYGPVIRLKNKDADGGTVEALLKEPTGSVTARRIAAWTVVQTGAELEADKTLSAEAWDDEYLYRWHSFVPGSEFDGDCFGSTQELGLYVDTGSGWTLVETLSISSGCVDVDSDRTETIVRDGVGATDQEGANFRILNENGVGDISNPDSGDAVSWEESTPPKEVGMTPGNVPPVSFFAEATT